MVCALDNALPHLQPPKRVRGKATEQDATGNPNQPHRRRRCRVSDEEAEQIRQNRLVGDPPLDSTVIVARPASEGSFSGFGPT